MLIKAKLSVATKAHKIPSSGNDTDCLVGVTKTNHLLLCNMYGKYESTSIKKYESTSIKKYLNYYSTVCDGVVQVTTRTGSKIVLSFKNLIDHDIFILLLEKGRELTIAS